MDTLHSMADELARDALKAAADHDDERIVDEVSKAIGALSTTLQESYVTSVRVRRAGARGRAKLAELVAAIAAGQDLKVTPDFSSDGH